MSVYMTEEEQLQAIKKWWNRYSNTITVILSLLLFVIAGFKYWNWHKAKVTQQASNTYEQLIVSYSHEDNKAVRAYANRLTKEYPETVYADAARMILAKLYVLQGKYPQAQKELAYVATHSKTLALKQIAKIRKARLLVAEKSYDQALAELEKVDDSAYMPVINELKGDIFVARGLYQKAFVAYRQAIVEVRTHGIGNPFLEMKTNELATLTQSMNDREPVQPA